MDTATGRPVSLDYGIDTLRSDDSSGNLGAVTITFDSAAVPPEVRVYLMVDTYPAATDTLTQ